jgi:hypothetical protein
MTITITYQFHTLIAEWLLRLGYVVMPPGVEKGALERSLDQYERDIAAALAFAAKLPEPN